MQLTTRLCHQRKVSGNGRLDLECQGHHREGHGPSPLGGCPRHDAAKDHGDAHDVVSGEVLEVVVPDGQAPPHQVVEREGDQDSDESVRKKKFEFHLMFDNQVDFIT